MTPPMSQSPIRKITTASSEATLFAIRSYAKYLQENRKRKPEPIAPERVYTQFKIPAEMSHAPEYMMQLEKKQPKKKRVSSAKGKKVNWKSKSPLTYSVLPKLKIQHH